MAYHRTKEQKMVAQQRREQLYSLTDISMTKSEKVEKNLPIATNHNVLSYPPKLIVHDLLRTAFSLVVIIGLLTIAWWYLR